MAEPKFGTSLPTVAVGVLIIDASGRILVGRFPKWGGKWCVFGGKLERGERMESCARREVKEETGLDVERTTFFRLYESIDDPDYYKPIHFLFVNFLCRVATIEVALNHEATEFLWVTPSEALKLDLNRSTRNFIEDYLTRVT